MKTYIVQVYSDERCGDTWAAYSNKDPEELEDAIVTSDKWLDIEADHISNWAHDYEDEDDEEYEYEDEDLNGEEQSEEQPEQEVYNEDMFSLENQDQESEEENYDNLQF